MFRWFIPVGAALALNVSAVLAAPPLPVPPTWTGQYIGAHIGYGWGDVDATLTSTTGSYDVNGVLAGVQAGRNWQNGSFVYGWIADLSLSGIDGRWVFDPGPPARHLTTDYDWLASLRGRVGPTYGNMLFFVTGGLAIAGIESVRSAPAASSYHTKVGYLIGLGIEWQGPAGWTYVIEYLHRDFGTQNLANYRLDHTLDTVTVGMNRRY